MTAVCKHILKTACRKQLAAIYLTCCILPVLPICSVKSKLWFKLRSYIWNRANHNLFKLQCATFILLLKSSIPTALLISKCLKSQFSAVFSKRFSVYYGEVNKQTWERSGAQPWCLALQLLVNNSNLRHSHQSSPKKYSPNIKYIKQIEPLVFEQNGFTVCLSKHE